MITWDGRVATPAERVENRCRAACPGDGRCACQCHTAAERVRALLVERFGADLELERASAGRWS